MSTATAVGAKDVNPGAVPQQLQSCRRKQESCLDITSGLIFTLTYLFINSSGSGMVLCCTLLLFFFFPYIASVRDLPQKARMTVYMETKYN